MAKKVYVVWHGRETGVLTDWQKCKDAIHGFPAAKYKAFKTTEAAQKAFKEGYELYWGRKQSLKVNFLPSVTKNQQLIIYIY